MPNCSPTTPLTSRDLTEQDLKDLGVLLGHRRKMLRAIAELDGVAPARIETATEPVLREEAERRHLTVMICDLVGSTALSARRPSFVRGVTAGSLCVGEPPGRDRDCIFVKFASEPTRQRTHRASGASYRSAGAADRDLGVLGVRN
jgi:hypothetical protein